jgi:transglutaminase-like putative cysteine protease
MSRRGGLGAGLLLAGTAAATTWWSMWSWRGFTMLPGRFLGPLLLLAVVVAGVGALTRWWRMPAASVIGLQVLASGMVASALLCGSPLPVGRAWDRLLAVFADAGTTASSYAAPVPASAPGVEPIFIVSGLACLLLVDVLACTLRRVPLAGLPLLTVFSVPVGLLGGGLSWWVFAGTAAGFLLLLFLHESEQVARWGRTLGSDPAEVDPGAFGVSTGAIRTTAATIGGVATALAVVLPLAIPTFQLRLFDIGQGPGGSSDITVTNPMTDLRRDLVQGEDVPLLRVRTDDPAPAYLRITSLTRFAGNEWSAGDRDVPAGNLPDGAMPELQGVGPTVPRRTYDYTVDVSEAFDSRWLPTQAPISRIQAPGDWRYDRSTMDFIAGSEDLDTAGARYSMTGVQLQLAATDMVRATSSSGLVSKAYTQLPPGIPSMVRTLANDVTRQAPSRFEKAVALQSWFRSEGGFVYDTAVSAGNGTDDLVAFLNDTGDGRRGYCEQFASAMAVMARVLGIPARVSVGFLQPRSVGAGLWEYSAHDLHAWPELFFPGAGWVRFEPTPGRRADSVPAYTTQRVPVGNPTDGAPSTRPRDELPDRGSSSSASASEAAGAQSSRGTDRGVPWLALLGGLAGVGAAVVLLLLPRGLRRTRRERRLEGGPEDAWAELHATALDLGVPWRDGRSPRETASGLVDHFGTPVDENTPERPAHGRGVDPDAEHALDLLVHELELLRYARDGGSAGGHRPHVRAETQTCLEALHGGAPRSARRRAEWWPRSVLTRSPAPRSAAQRPVPSPHGGVVDHVG